MLRACACLLRRPGRLAFLTIEPAANLNLDDLQRAIDSGPFEVAIEAPHEDMLTAAGFSEITVVDVTEDFDRTQREWAAMWDQHRARLVELLGQDLVDQRQADRQAMRSAIDQGLLHRTLYVARRS